MPSDDRFSSALVELMDGCPRVRWIIQSSSSVYSKIGVSLEVQRWMRK